MTDIADAELARQILLDAGADPAKVRVEKMGFGWLVAAVEFGAGCTDSKDNSMDTPQEVAAHLVGKGLSNGGDASGSGANPDGVPDAQPETPLADIRDAYEDSHTDNEGAGDVGLAEHTGIDLGGDGGELVEAPEDDPAGDPADYSAEPVGDDLEPADEHQTEDVSPANLGGVLIQGDALATAKAMALMAVDDERFARVGDYDKAANQTKLDELRAIQQAIREGVHPPFTDEQAAELQALETFLPFTQRIDDHAQGLRNAIRDAADLEQLTAIDLLNGWPD